MGSSETVIFSAKGLHRCTPNTNKKRSPPLAVPAGRSSPGPPVWPPSPSPHPLGVSGLTLAGGGSGVEGVYPRGSAGEPSQGSPSTACIACGAFVVVGKCDWGRPGPGLHTSHFPRKNQNLFLSQLLSSSQLFFFFKF